MCRSGGQTEIVISAGDDTDDEDYVSLSVEYYRSLLQSKRELRLLKAGIAAELQDQARQSELRSPAEKVTVQLGVAELIRDYPELVEYATSLTFGQMMDRFPELFEIQERDDC